MKKIPGIKNYSEGFIKKKSIIALNKAIKICGGHATFIRKLDIYGQLIASWKGSRCGVCPRYVIAIENLTGGLVTRHQLRIDIFQ